MSTQSTVPHEVFLLGGEVPVWSPVEDGEPRAALQNQEVLQSRCIVCPILGDRNQRIGVIDAEPVLCA
ncbi:hypothetical protein ACHABQ_14175, partial [Nesterenkonia aurantiaca]|uniref:hypothetical protein n=1 Tax=Nesterenkonia aurantiaca TaxID=1436010 RepID=UPI003EE42972